MQKQNLLRQLSLLFLVAALSWQLSLADDSFQLRQVQIVTRHGARAPYELFEGDPVEWNCKLHPFGSVGTNASDTLKPAGRTYSRSYIPGRQVQPGNCAQGELTSYGRMQHVELGKSVRQMYKDLLPSSFNDQEIYVRSTDVPRTIECAASFLSGMYPETDANVPNINIWLIEADADDMQPSTSCNLLNHMCNEATQTAAWFDVDVSMEPLRHMLADKWNLTFEDVPWWGGIRNNIECMKAHNLTLPLYMTPDIVDIINRTATWQLGQVYNNVSRAKLLIGRFLAELRDNITQFVKEVPGVPKFFLYSGHDTTVGPLLGALQAWQDIWPPFASHLHLELYQDANGQFFVRGLFNGNVISFGGCDEYCPLLHFYNVVADSVPLHYDQECSLEDPVEPATEYTQYMC